MRSRRIETAVLPDLQGSSLLTKEGLLTVSRKPDNIASKSNDNHNVELKEQS